MDIKLLDYIKELSNNDKKSLSQKALKTSEEVGELAKAVLPYEDAQGTKHRFVDKEKILQEVADTILSSISIAYHLNFTHEEITDMLSKKASYWQYLQSKEEKIEGKTPFEIHVTIKRPDDIEKYKEDCKSIGVKPIVLDLEQNDQSIMIDVMTSSTTFGNNSDAYFETNRIADELESYGYTVLRKKIETVPWHPAAPCDSDDNPTMPNDCYFESHLQIVTTEERRNDLSIIAKNNDSHLSRNFFKKRDDGTYIIMITKRSYEGTYESFLKDLEYLKEELKVHKFEFEKEIVEFSIYDTKISHDFKWLTKEVIYDEI